MKGPITVTQLGRKPGRSDSELCSFNPGFVALIFPEDIGDGIDPRPGWRQMSCAPSTPLEIQIIGELCARVMSSKYAALDISIMQPVLLLA